jgi:hypothetical protein
MKDSEDIVQEMIDCWGTKLNGLITMCASDVALCMVEEYCEARIREGNFDGECIGETGVNDMLLATIGTDMDRESCYDMIESIKNQMTNYYSDDLDESIEKNLREINFPEEDPAPSIGWSAVHTIENPPKLSRAQS